ncbi:cell wall / vacuolar inhibitor of fructosidase 1-like [Rosa rugosa]|uniref:cell wall / vacuolar inhibitor of fructosidase 1-like n=1 Tax=Rosa rugosa TaxID=74645 RepID=UPI002B408909|nr:cell wall / vacuolar inhibitor of fructosidase 1-like [Rosa rugosa]
MKSLMCLAGVLILFVQTAVLPTEANIVGKTCSRTPNPSVCLSSLKSDPRSAQADIYGLAVIMIDVVKAKSTATLNKINQLLKKSPGDKSLKDCAESYKAIVEYFPTVYQAIKLGRAMFALEGMNNAVIGANTCEQNFPGSRSDHPLTKFNKDVADVASVAAAIIDEFP